MTHSFVVAPDGTRLAVERAGTGAPVLMLHGSGGGLHSWAPVAAELTEGFEVWSIARRGYSPSDAPAGPNSFAREVADVRAVLAAIGDRPTHLVGSSYGATLALHVARALPGLQTLSLWEPPLFSAGPGLTPVLEQYRRSVADRDWQGGSLLLAEQVARVPPPLLEAMARAEPEPSAERDAVGWLSDLEALAGDEDDIARWADVSLPTLLLQGADTWAPMPATMDRLAAALPGVERISYPGQLHFAPSLIPDVVAASLRDFLGRHPPAT